MKESFTGKTIIDDEEKRILTWCKENEDLVRLLSSNEDLKNILTALKDEDILSFTSGLTNEYINRRIGDKGRIMFVFEKIDSTNELYNQNHWTIESYYERLINEYIRETGLPYELAKKEFNKNTGTLFEVVSLLSSDFKNTSHNNNASINKILSSKDWDAESFKTVRKLNNLLVGVYLPNYKKKYVKFPNEINSVHTIVEEKDKELLVWAKENNQVVRLLSNNSDLKDALKTIAIDDIPDFVTNLINAYAKNKLEKEDRIHYEFELITTDNLIYNQNAWTIENYYIKLVKEYAIKTGLPYDIAKKEFDDLSVSFDGVITYTLRFTNNTVAATDSIKESIAFKWNEKGMADVKALKNYLKSLYLPNYNKKYIVTPGEADKTNELLKMENEVLKAQVLSLKQQLANQADFEDVSLKEKSIK